MKRKFFKTLAVFLALNILVETVFPSVAFALSGGPSQPEVESFEPIGTTEMVDLFSGDFVYNIPLLNVGNYPINISYHSGVSMDQEASWVGLGWNINPGAITRNMRGLPDDFNGAETNGDIVTRKFNIRPNRTYGVTGKLDLEIFGKGKSKSKGDAAKATISLGLGVNYNNYKGFGMEQTIGAGINASKSGKGPLTADLGLTSSSSEGLTIAPSLSFEMAFKNKDKSETNLGSVKVGSSFNSRAGLSGLTLHYTTPTLTMTRRVGVIYKSKKAMAKFKGSVGGSLISFVAPSYTPSSGMSFVNTSVSLSFKAGATFLGLDGTYQISGYYSEQKLLRKTENLRAFGYMNSEKGMSDDKALHDFNREKEVGFTKNTPALPLTNYTYDVYAVAGQGIGGMYRPFRSDVGYVYDSKTTSSSGSYSLGIEGASGNLVKGGADVRVNIMNSKTNRWGNNNDLANNQKFIGKTDDDIFYEPYYFKQAGEKSVDPDYLTTNQTGEAFFDKLGGFSPVRPKLVEKGGLEVGTTNELVSSSNVTKTLSPGERRKTRQKRNENISLLNIKEATHFAIDKSVFNDLNTSSGLKISSQAKQHHIGEITSVNAQGARYVYGIPAYNTRQIEASFNVDHPGSGGVDNNGLITYGSDDNTTENEKGLDHFFSSTELPPFAHSYLLTSVLSPDYVDNDGVNGPSKGDMGSYTKFNYEKSNSNYKWRVPLGGNNQASYNEGLKSLNEDDKASYLYGEKELWYIKSIEDKNYIAIFELGYRGDGYGVLNENGGLDTDKDKGMKCLRSIKLYYKKDYEEHLELGTTPIAIKTVNFEYDYSLCQGVSNSNTSLIIDKSGKISGNSNDPGYDGVNVNATQHGKLTLKKIYFTYQNSNKAKFSPYEFTYGYNPNYNLKAYDRWGTYKAITGSLTDATDFPYTDQNATNTNNYAQAWNLTKINLPSGGDIEVQYESDDYAYVQDKQAMQMFKLVGIVDKNDNVSDKLYNKSLFPTNHYDFVVVDLGKSVSTTDFKNNYLKGISNLYFRVKVDIGYDGNQTKVGKTEIDEFEYIPGYCTIKTDDCYTIGNNGYIKVNKIALGEKKNGTIEINPITKAALQFSRLHTTRIAYDQPDPEENGIVSVLKGIANSGIINNFKDMLLGINGSMLAKGFCHKIEADNSYVRLLSPDKQKLGGGCRVAQIKIKDNADDTGMGAVSEYGQAYEYKVFDSALNKYISSGVASYEPLIGGDENPFRLPIAYGKKQEKFLIPDDRFYLEAPLGESFFPSASVGYSRVKVTSLNSFNKHSSGQRMVKHGTGCVVHEFYTANDFPTLVDKTDIIPYPLFRKRSPLPLRLLKINSRDYVTTAQGYVVELNDMHGKPKAEWVYAEGKDDFIDDNGIYHEGSYTSGVEHKYKSEGKRLKNDAQVIAPDGSTKTAMIGVDFDFVNDMREETTKSTSVGLNVNIVVFTAGPFPGTVPLIIPAYGKERTRFRSAVATKVINRYGILEETIAHDLGAKVSTQNLAWDGETGEVLLTQVKNNFEDPIYNFTYPAHWAYDRMGPAYINIGVEQNVDFIDPGETPVVAQSAIQRDPYEIGDEVIFLSSEAAVTPDLEDEILHFRYYVVRKQNGKAFMMGGRPTSGCKYLPQGKGRVKVIRSGRRNMSNIPIGTVTTLLNPLKNRDNTLKAKIDFNIFDHKTLSASSAEFSDEWGLFCDCGIQPGNLFNPVFYGVKGNWRLKKTYTYLTGRTKTPVEANLRKDGPFTSFNSFWNYPASGIEWQKDDNNWRWVNEVTQFDPYGSTEIENKDPLLRYAAAGNGYFHQAPVSVSSNAKYSDLFSDNFEDYNQSSCIEQLSKFNANIDAKSHTGRKSVRVLKDGSPASLTIIPGCR